MRVPQRSFRHGQNKNSSLVSLSKSAMKNWGEGEIEMIQFENKELSGDKEDEERDDTRCGTIPRLTHRRRYDEIINPSGSPSSKMKRKMKRKMKKMNENN